MVPVASTLATAWMASGRLGRLRSQPETPAGPARAPERVREDPTRPCYSTTFSAPRPARQGPHEEHPLHATRPGARHGRRQRTRGVSYAR